MVAEMITYFSAIYFNSLYIHAIGKPVRKSRESFSSVIGLMKAVQWSYQSHQNKKEIQLFNICHRHVKTFLFSLST